MLSQEKKIFILFIFFNRLNHANKNLHQDYKLRNSGIVKIKFLSQRRAVIRKMTKTKLFQTVFNKISLLD